MQRFAKTKVLPAWIALLAFLFGVLAPTVSHAIAASMPQAQAAEVCTSTGIKLVAPVLSNKAGPASGAVLKGFMHCDFCATHAGSFALLPQSKLALAVPDGNELFPSLFYQSPTPLFAWTLAKSRAPPAASV
jgi:hypothetical protein